MVQIRLRWKTLAALDTLNALRGAEGAAAAAYFAAYTEQVPPQWQFNGRKRRPPPDPVNAILSLTFTLLNGEAIRALLSHGLDPAIGALHDLAYSRDSLACDLMELLRTSAETWVLNLFKSAALDSGHFQYPEAGKCMLNKEGRALFYPLYQQQAILWRQRCRDFALAWAKNLDPVAAPIGENNGKTLSTD
jgi:CRISPR-associated protein Cas1